MNRKHIILRLAALLATVAVFATPGARAQDQPAYDGPWTMVHIKAPAGSSLCVSGQRVPEGVFDFRVAQDVYEIMAFGPGLPRTRTKLDATSAPAELDLVLPVPPSLDGTWTGTMSGQPATLEITAGSCDQPGCELDHERPEGLAGRLTGAVDGIASTWLLREFDWVESGRVLACRALVANPTVDVDPAAMPPDFALWLVMAEDGAFIGKVMIADAGADDDFWSEDPDSDTSDAYDDGAPAKDHTVSFTPATR